MGRASQQAVGRLFAVPPPIVTVSGTASPHWCAGAASRDTDADALEAEPLGQTVRLECDYTMTIVYTPAKWRLDKVTPRLFPMWGRHQADARASYQNSHLPVWFGRTHHPEAAACDALIQPDRAIPQRFSPVRCTPESPVEDQGGLTGGSHSNRPT